MSKAFYRLEFARLARERKYHERDMDASYRDLENEYATDQYDGKVPKLAVDRLVLNSSEGRSLARYDKSVLDRIDREEKALEKEEFDELREQDISDRFDDDDL